jgi:TRAP transporter TAXI family solute receptor
MKKRIIAGRSPIEYAAMILAVCSIVAGAALLARKYANPAPPRRIVIATGNEEGGYGWFAGRYAKILEKDGIQLEARPTSGARQNLELLNDPASGIDVAFVQDGLEAKQHDTTLVSLGSLYYEPLWIFYRSPTELTRLSQLKGKRLVIGEHGGGTPALAGQLLKASGVEKTNSELLRLDYDKGAEALVKGEADAAFFIARPGHPLIKKLLASPVVRVMSLDQAEAMSRQFPYLHHLVLPHGSVDLATDVPNRDVDLVAPTATLVARDTFHPALIDLLLKAATQVHREPSVFERKGEFPIDKDYVFPISDEAHRFYRDGTPFWQRYLPFWLAVMVQRFILVAVPLLAVIYPLLRSIPQIMEWLVKRRIYQRYGELKYLETQLATEKDEHRYAEHLKELDAIEDRVSRLRIPLKFTEHFYGLRAHIDFVRGRLGSGPKNAAPPPPLPAEDAPARVDPGSPAGQPHA